MKKLFFTSIIAMATIVPSSVSGNSPAWTDLFEFTSKAPEKNHIKANDKIALHKVTVNFTYDQKNELLPGRGQEWVRVVSGSYYEEYLIDDYEVEVDDTADMRTVSIEVEVPREGAFIYLEPTIGWLRHPGYLKMVKHVNPLESATIDFFASEAIHRIAYRMRNPQGVELKLPTAYFDSEKGEYIITKDGNAVQWFASLGTYLDGHYINFNTYSTEYITDMEGENDNHPMDVWTNFTGDELVISYTGFVIGKQQNEVYGCYGSVNATVNETIYNDINTFFTTKANIDDKTASKADTESLYSVNITEFTDKEFNGSIGLNAKDATALDVLQVSKFPDMDSEIYYGITYGITDQQNEIKYQTPNYMNGPNGHFVTLLYDKFGNSDIDIIPMSDLFNIAPEKLTHKFFTGPSVLTCTWTEMPYYKDPGIVRLYPVVTNFGYAGDLRLADSEQLQWKITFDNNILCENADRQAANKSLNDWTASKPENGTLNWTVVSPTYDIGDKETTTLIENTMQWHMSSAIAVPTLSALMIRDSEQNVTYDLKSVENATLTIAAYASVYDRISADGDLVMQPVSIVAEYSANDSDDWKELNLQIIDNGAIQTALGTVGIAHLENIGTDTSEYIDLRITVTNQDGDKQVQTIRPAFHINPESIIKNIVIESQTEIFTYYDLQGRQVYNPQSGLYIRASHNSDGNITYDKVRL